MVTPHGLALASLALQACVTPGQMFRTEAGALLRWPVIPIQIVSADVPLIFGAGAFWNTLIGVTVFEQAYDCMTSCVLVHTSSTTGNDNDAQTQLYLNDFTGIIELAVVRVSEGSERDIRVLVHELGHVLTLRHDDDNPLSVMYPVNLHEAWKVEAKDLAYLRSHYATH